MPQDTISPLYDLEPDPALEARLDAEAQADCEAGRVIPHERVRAWLMKLAHGDKLQPPEP